MSEFLADVEYGAGDGESTRLPPTRCRLRNSTERALVVVLGVAAALMGLVVLLATVVPLPSRKSLPSPVPGDGLLADVRGEDTLHRLAVTQAALRREMALLRQRASKGDEDRAWVPQADLVRAVAELEAGQALLRSLLGHLESDRERLAEIVEACQVELAMQTRRVGIQEQTPQEHLSEEGN